MLDGALYRAVLRDGQESKAVALALSSTLSIIVSGPRPPRTVLGFHAFSMSVHAKERGDRLRDVGICAGCCGEFLRRAPGDEARRRWQRRLVGMSCRLSGAAGRPCRARGL